MDFSSSVNDLSICIIPVSFSSPAVQEMQSQWNPRVYTVQKGIIYLMFLSREA